MSGRGGRRLIYVGKLGPWAARGEMMNGGMMNDECGTAHAAAPGAAHAAPDTEAGGGHEARQYVAMRGCASCPFRGDPCHEARQRVMDAQVESGRHYECDFHRAIHAARAAAAATVRRPPRGGTPIEWLLRLLGSEG